MIVKRIINWCVVAFILSVLVANIFGPLLRKTSDGKYKKTVKRAEYESDEKSTERVRCIDDGSDAFLWRLKMIAAAKKNIVLSTFDMRNDKSGTSIMAALYDAAERGVKVQVIVDGIFEIPNLKGQGAYSTLVSHENVDLRIYNPVNLKNLYRLNFRMHDKYLIADDRIYMLGGRNTNDIFLGEYKKCGKTDREILVYETVPGEGKSLMELQEYFAQIWNEPCVKRRTAKPSRRKKEKYEKLFSERLQSLKKKYGKFTEYTDWADDTYEVNKITLASNNIYAFNKEPKILNTVEQLATNGEDVLIQSPYIIADRYMYSSLEKIAESADLKIIINAVEKGANPWGCADYLNQQRRISKTGMKVYEMIDEQVSHTKTILIDKNISVVGSYNLDMRSTYMDTELMLVIDSEELNSHLRKAADEYMEKSIHVLSEKEDAVELFSRKDMQFIKKLVYSILRIIIIPFRYLL